MPVYRTYLEGARPPSSADRLHLEHALSQVRARTRGEERAFALLYRVLLPRAEDGLGSSRERRRFVTRFQQLSAATMAKGLEDTAHYLYYPLAHLNEVGGGPSDLSEAALAEFHVQNQRRSRTAMVTVTTHDTKRSADARTRLSVLSEMPTTWIDVVGRWRRQNAEVCRGVDPNTEYLLYQTLVALRPRGGNLLAPEVLEGLRHRVEEYMLKAVREGRRRSSWQRPNRAFETVLLGMIRSLFGVACDGQAQLVELNQTFVATELVPFVQRIDRAAMTASLARSVLHYTVPGIPDTYQGDELWQLTAVDPDNRHAVNFLHRSRLLSQIERFDQADPAVQSALAHVWWQRPEDGKVNLHVVRSALKLRRQLPDLFADGEYIPIRASGGERAPVVAFARVHDQQVVITVAPRFGSADLSGVTLEIPERLLGAQVKDVLTGRTLTIGSSLAARELFVDLPVALLAGTL
jgi:(1->4)-alpha-D-glucan 1-alpha-D-glucosylmutase